MGGPAKSLEAFAHEGVWQLTKKKEDLSKEGRVKKETNRLRRLLKEIPPDRLNAVASLIRNAAFMTVTLEDLQTKINEDGAVAEYQNGENQWGTKKSPEVEIYNTMVKNHAAIMKQLTDLIPATGPLPQKPAEPDPYEKIRDRRK